jgi:cyclopropane-fatty-acyl-phospholipid synthase
MLMSLRRVFGYVVKTGHLTVREPGGRQFTYGDGTGAEIVVRIKDRMTALRLVLDPDLSVGECYMDGSLTVERGTIYDFLSLMLGNAAAVPPPAGVKIPLQIRRVLRRLHQRNPIGLARRNVSHHYDIDGRIYDLFLDRDRQYSCAYFEAPDRSLDEAQLAKKRHLASKLAIEPGMRVLDIGSGWGGLALYLAEVCGAEVVGVTLSQEQHALSVQRAAQGGLGGRAQFRLMDYREVDGTFDRIVSVGMFEHVGIGHYREFFDKVRALLEPDGVAILHSICRADGPNATSAWTKKYIFPGGYIPALSEVLPPIEKSGLYLTDIEVLRLHYAQTLREWRRRFADHRDTARRLMDERFCRMWEFYLAASECAFRYAGMNNVQIQLCRHQHALPIVRDYMQREENRLRAQDAGRPRLKSVPGE